MATVLVEVSTRPQTFPLNTVETPFRFSIENLDGFVLSFVDTAAAGASFPQVPAGSYVAKVEKNGVLVSRSFSVERENETFAVPNVITVSFS